MNANVLSMGVVALLAMGACAAGRPAASPSTSAAPGSTAKKPMTSAPSLAERARALHASAIVIDTHDDITSKMLDEGFDLATSGAKVHTDLARMRAGGITGEFFAIYVDPDFTKPGARGGGPARRALDMIDVTYQQIERHPDALVMATTAADIRRAKREGKTAVLMGIEGGHAIENSLFALREFYRLGVRYMTLTHANTNDWADSAGGFGPPPPVRHHGLSAFGEDVVREMQRVGMLVDVSHVSDETVDDVLRVAKAPVIASHSSARALADHVRNLSDEHLRAIGANGGVVMVNFFPGYIDAKRIAADKEFGKKHEAEIAEIREKYKNDSEKRFAELVKLRASEPAPKTPLSVLVDHIEHVAKVAGIDHVGLGSDFDGISALPEGLDGIDGLPKITLALLERGHTDDEVRKILGENFLRVMESAEAYARSTRTTLSGDGKTTRIAE